MQCNRACHFFFPRKALNVSEVASVAASGRYPPESILPYTAMSGYSPNMLDVDEGPNRYIPTATWTLLLSSMYLIVLYYITLHIYYIILYYIVS